MLPNFLKTGRYIIGSLAVDISNSYVVEESYVATELMYAKPNWPEVHSFKRYVYTLSDIKRLLEWPKPQTMAVYTCSTKRPLDQMINNYTR